MIERIQSILKTVREKWQQRSSKQKVGIYSLAGVVLVALLLVIILTNYKHYVPLYSNLSIDEAGQIKQTLDSKGVPYKLLAGGTTISVPEKQVDALKVDLAAQGIPKSGQIDYSIFGKNTNFGMTDNQFNVLQRAAVQTELSNLISGMNGVNSSKVMINLPQQSVWVSDQPNKASASIVLQLKPGYQLTDSQVTGLYNLVSKSVPNLPTSNIVIMDQNFNYYDQNSLKNSTNSTLSVFQQQQQIKSQIEKDLRQRVQQMLGIMMGQDKVMVNVTTNIDFTKTTSKQKLVQPVDTQTMQGLVVSSENIQNTYNGAGGTNQTAGTGSSSVPNYPSSTTSGSGTSNSVDNKVNYVFNQINNDVQSSPYKLTDLGIQVMVEPPNPNKPSTLTKKSVSDIKSILNTIVQTSLNQTGGTLTPQQIASKSVITVDQFNGKQQTAVTPVKAGLPKWVWAAGAGALVIIIFLLFLALRRRKQANDLELDPSMSRQIDKAVQKDEPLPSSEDSPEALKKKQLEIMVKENPQDFVKLLRSWLSEE